MGNKRKAKRSLSSLPKGLIQRKGATSADPGNPFEVTARMKRPKHQVHNRPVSRPKNTEQSLQGLHRRQSQLRSTLSSTKKANVFVDRRIGQYDPTMSQDDQMLARLVKERSRRSKKVSKYQLDDDSSDMLTHKGKRLDPSHMEAILSDDEDDFGDLEAIDTELHFGGSGQGKSVDPYGGSSAADLAQVYDQRKTELDDLIARRKMMKAERMQAKEAQIETVEKMDENFAGLSQLLQFRKDKPASERRTTPTAEEEEMDKWNVEMRQMMMKPKKKATDRTKTPDEIAKEEAERLHELETRRLARMNGDFDEDDLSDISLAEGHNNNQKSRGKHRNPDELSDSEHSDLEDEPEARFTADGLKYIDKDGNVVESPNDAKRVSTSDKEEAQDEDGVVNVRLEVGTRVRANYRADEQYAGHETWYDGIISKVHDLPEGRRQYDVEYDDGDLEENMSPKNVRPVEGSALERTKEKESKEEGREEAARRGIARERARKEMPFVFEVPTTLEALNDIISRHAATGKDVSTIIQRIHKANSVRLDRRNLEKMQNFYDVLLRRFVAVGDAIFSSGGGGEELGRYGQLTALTHVIYALAQDSPESAGSIWNRRIGIFQNAHSKRLRDSELVGEDDEMITAWPSVGTFLLLRSMGHVFPVTDRRHHVTTPTILLLNQMIAHTPVKSTYDIVLGLLCSGLVLEYTKEARRVSPEALGFLGGVIQLYSPNPGQFALPSLEVAYNVPAVKSMRSSLVAANASACTVKKLKLDQSYLASEGPEIAVSILSAALDLVEHGARTLNGAFAVPAEAEVLAELSESMLCLQSKLLPDVLRSKLSAVAKAVAQACPETKTPLRRGQASSATDGPIQTLAPRMQDPDRYSMSRDKGKKSVQAAIDRTRREYKREHKAISRELRLDATFIENERRTEQTSKEDKARAKRQKNFAWLEGEQASMNQQVRLGGGLLKGGGMGAAKAKAATAKMGIKKGGKF